MRIDSDQADRAFARQRAKPFNHAGGGTAQTRRAAGFDGDQVAVLGVICVAGRNGQFLAEHLLVDRLKYSAAGRYLAEYSQDALLGMIDDLDDAAPMANAVVFVGLLDMQQHAVADTGGFAESCPARRVNADLWRGPVRLLVPFVGGGDEFAIAVARGHVGKDGRG